MNKPSTIYHKLVMDFTFNLPFCLHLPDGDYSVILSEDSPIILKLQKIVPQKYDERWGIRGIIEQDLINVSKVKIWNQEVSKRDWNVKVIDAKDIPNISELCEVLAFVDDNGNDLDVSDKTAYRWERILLNAEIIGDRLGRLRYTRVTIISDSPDNSKARIVSAVNKLIDTYRSVSGEHWLYHVREDDILFSYSEGQSGHEGFSKAKQDIHREAIEEMKSRLSSREPVSIYDSLLLNTRSALYEEKYSSAVLYSFIYLELALRTLIRMLVDKEILSKKTADRMQMLHLYQLVTVGLRLLMINHSSSAPLVCFCPHGLIT